MRVDELRHRLTATSVIARSGRDLWPCPTTTARTETADDLSQDEEAAVNHIRRTTRRVAIVAITAIAIVLVPAVAWADTGRDFGGHVVNCARTIGFNGQHNPGMHQGFAGFTPHTC
jgi:hypothetical protein